MKKSVILAVILLFTLCIEAQQEENNHSAVSRNLEIFNDIYKQLDLYYVDSLSADTVIGWGISSMLHRVDPFTDYYPANDEELRQMATGKYAGIGSVIRLHKKEDRAMIVEPYEGTPSDKVGLRAGDVIMTIDGKDVKGMSTSSVSNMLRGEAGTTFELRVKRGPEGKILPFKITRQTIQMPQVPYYGVVRPGVGYIYLTGFTDGACREVRQALMDLKGQGATSLVLDLRENPGGALSEAVDITNLFVPKGKKVVFTKGKLASVNREYYTASEPVDTVMPVVVMVDGGTASSAEIVSGSLQDMDRAVILGSRTYGKGLVQMIREVPYRGNLKITTSRYYIPSGRCIQAHDYKHDGTESVVPDSLRKLFHTEGGRDVYDGGGITPDIEVKPDSLPAMIYDLVASDAFFDFATKYASEHKSIAPAGQVALTDEEYADFVKSITESDFTYNKRSEDVFKLLTDVARREGYMDSAKAEFEALEAKLKTNDLKSDLERFRKDIEPYIADELVHRYYYQKGGVQQQLVKDPCMDRALELLSQPEEYSKILKP